MRNEERYYLFTYLEANKEKLNLAELNDGNTSAHINVKLDFNKP